MLAIFTFSSLSLLYTNPIFSQKIKLDNITVWTGTATSGTNIILDTAFAIPVLTEYSSRNKLEFDSVMNDDGETFQIMFTFSDNSTFTTVVYNS